MSRPEPPADPPARPAAAADLEVVLVAAVADNGVIGADGGMPWHYPADLEHFRETTTGHPVVMGRRTYEGVSERLGGPLPDRTNVVLSRGTPRVPPEVRLVGSVPEALVAAAAAPAGSGTAYVAGGATVYAAFLPLADRLVLTEIHDAHEGDTYFPAWDRDDWRATERDRREAFDFAVYERAE